MNSKTEKELLTQTGDKIQEVLDNGIDTGNLEYLYKVVDIHKDALKIQKMKGEIEMRYGEYNRGGYGNYGENYGENYGRGRNYGEGYGRDSYGRERYGRRGYDAKYRGDDMIDEMYDHYHEYHEGKSYGAKEDTTRSLEYMMKSVVDFIKMLEQDASSQEEMEIIKKYTRHIGEM